MKPNIYITLLSLLLFSCTDDTFAPGSTDSFVSISGIVTRAYAGTDTLTNNTRDLVVTSLRVLAFDSGNACESNVLYSGVSLGQSIQHAIAKGTYSFVFLANEASDASVRDALDAIDDYSDLINITYPASAFTSDLEIPMIQTLANVQVLAEGQIKVGSADAVSTIDLTLTRLGARVDVVLTSDEDLGDVFTGVTFSNIPNGVPLISDNYGGARTTMRSFKMEDDAGYFEDISTGSTWGMRVKRIVLPANVFTDTDAESKAIVFTVNLEGMYNPSCKLKIYSATESGVDKDNYTLPKNARLDLTANVIEPLNFNIVASEWGSELEEWGTVEIRALNVSHVSANITDFNGARITFTSNMPVVRVLDKVIYNETEGLPTNEVFNDLVGTTGISPTRFYYDYDYGKSAGTGYMDVMVDSYNNSPGNYRYKLYLSAEQEGGANQLIREITINVAQEGTRYALNKWGEQTSYIGAFFRNEQTGERIISNLHGVGMSWSATVISGVEWITISSAPSFDPKVGTDDPGNPEHYEVVPNTRKYSADKNEMYNWGGTVVNGRGRVYFRVGTRSKNTVVDTETNSILNRYGVIRLNFHMNDGQNVDRYLYIRQGETDDYVFRNTEVVSAGTLTGYTRDYARKFSPYNLTASAYKGAGSSADYVQLAERGGEFVEYPSQAGAFFQWGRDNATGVMRRAYHPAKSTHADWDYYDENDSWNRYKDTNETCPTGYVRPNDGYEDRKTYNGPYFKAEAAMQSSYADEASDGTMEIQYSTFRTSLFKIPEAGNSYGEYIIYNTNGYGEKIGIQSAGVYPTFPTTTSSGASTVIGQGYLRELPETREGFYADGFFDRRPIAADVKAVSVGNANIAYSGLLFFNEGNNNASLFFPMPGRLNNQTGNLEYRGAGYYWTSSIGPWYPNSERPAWSFMLAYYQMEATTAIKSFGLSIRCVKEE